MKTASSGDQLEHNPKEGWGKKKTFVAKFVLG
jgi:hypothetical protein